MQYRDFEARMSSAQRPAKPDFMACKTCKCEWFEQIRANKFDANVSVVAPGQQLRGDFTEFTFLKCIKCGDLQEIPAAVTNWDRTSQDRYLQLMKDLEETDAKTG